MANVAVKNAPYGQVRKLYNSEYSNTKIKFRPINAKAKSVLPFRVRFTTIGIEAYGSNNPAPVGIAVIGLNNYIL
jgi:hypothetical protein